MVSIDTSSTLLAIAHQGLRASLKGAACSVAIVIVIGLSIAIPIDAEANIVPSKSLKALAKYQLTTKQYKCHNEIVFRESTWRIDAVNGSHHGYYQIKSKYIIGKPYDVQFYAYWYYCAKRYGLDHEIPNYCNALNHLKIKGWQ
tara:strand:- start:57 stop:488 length:432 start_codon:yes stop_codon:yes gene_type:complete